MNCWNNFNFVGKLVGKLRFPYDPFLLVGGIGFIVYISMIAHFGICGSLNQSKNPQ